MYIYIYTIIRKKYLKSLFVSVSRIDRHRKCNIYVAGSKKKNGIVKVLFRLK